MKSISVYPGRIRLESDILIGQQQHCNYLQKFFSEKEGVIQVNANHHTGRILVNYNQTLIQKEEILSEMENLLSNYSKFLEEAKKNPLPVDVVNPVISKDTLISLSVDLLGFILPGKLKPIGQILQFFYNRT